jgi:hypothetical protein
VIDDPYLRAEPFLPALRADPRLDIRAERARKPYLPGTLSLLAAPRADHHCHAFILQTTITKSSRFAQ